jgi:hypothetical protein
VEDFPKPSVDSDGRIRRFIHGSHFTASTKPSTRDTCGWSGDTRSNQDERLSRFGTTYISIFKKGDSAVVATLARILERTWDVEQGELRKNSPDVWGQIDSAMDGFIKPLMGYAKNAPDPSSVEMAYKTFLEKLKQAD